ncbi:MAG: NUDIX domain-containing protein [Clostridiales bacterium]|nr:NUDIX domain-containing protein [Clostridiales bacterium]
MAEDCKFTCGSSYFRFRAGAFILNDGKMLFVKSNFGDYLYVTGGAVNMCETTEHCIIREIKEELGTDAKIERLAVITENFFRGVGGNIDGLDCHTIEFYYIISIENADGVRGMTDDGEELIWVPVEDIKNTNIKPSFITERMDEILGSHSILHIIEERDR